MPVNYVVICMIAKLLFERGMGWRLVLGVGHALATEQDAARSTLV